MDDEQKINLQAMLIDRNVEVIFYSSYKEAKKIDIKENTIYIIPNYKGIIKEPYIYTYSFFDINPTKHHLYIIHKRTENIFSNNIPYIYNTDKISKWFGFQEDEVIEIIRKDNSKYYRKVLRCV